MPLCIAPCRRALTATSRSSKGTSRYSAPFVSSSASLLRCPRYRCTISQHSHCLQVVHRQHGRSSKRLAASRPTRQNRFGLRAFPPIESTSKKSGGRRLRKSFPMHFAPPLTCLRVSQGCGTTYKAQCIAKQKHPYSTMTRTVPHR